MQSVTTSGSHAATVHCPAFYAHRLPRGSICEHLIGWDRIPCVKVVRTKVVPSVARLATAFTGDGIEGGWAVMTAFRIHSVSRGCYLFITDMLANRLYGLWNADNGLQPFTSATWG